MGTSYSTPSIQAKFTIQRTKDAITVYQAEYSKLPVSLNDLVEESLLPNYPTDPWGFGLEYTTSPDGYVLESYGVNKGYDTSNLPVKPSGSSPFLVEYGIMLVMFLLIVMLLVERSNILSRPDRHH